MSKLTQDEIVFLERILDEKCEISMWATGKLGKESPTPYQKELVEKSMDGIKFMWDLSEKLKRMRNKKP